MHKIGRETFLLNNKGYRIHPTWLPTRGENTLRWQEGSLWWNINEASLHPLDWRTRLKQESFQTIAIFFSHLPSGWNLHWEKRDGMTMRQVSNEGGVFLRLKRMATGDIWIPWASQLEYDNFLQLIIENHDIGLESSDKNVRGYRATMRGLKPRHIRIKGHPIF